MPGPFDFDDPFNRGLQFGVEATQRKAQIEQRYREQQELAAYRRAMADLQARQLDMSEQRMEEEQRRYDASLVPAITGVEAGGPMGFQPRVEQVPLDVAKYQQGLRAYEDKLRETKQSEMERAAALEGNKAFAAELAGKAGLDLSDEALAGAAGNLGTLGNLAITNIARRRGGGGGPAYRPTADERFLQGVMSLPPEERLPFVNSQLQAIDQAATDSGRGLSASEMDMRRRLSLLRKQLELSGEPVPQVQQQGPPRSTLRYGGMNDFMQRLGAAQAGVPAAVGGLQGGASAPRTVPQEPPVTGSNALGNTLQRLGRITGAGPDYGSVGNPVQVQSPADVDALPIGAYFITPSGQVIRKERENK